MQNYGFTCVKWSVIFWFLGAGIGNISGTLAGSQSNEKTEIGDRFTRLRDYGAMVTTTTRLSVIYRILYSSPNSLLEDSTRGNIMYLLP